MNLNYTGRRVLICAAIVVAVGLMAGCSSFPPVKLKHSQTGAAITCEGWEGQRPNEWIAFAKQRACVDDYQRQGYARVP